MVGIYTCALQKFFRRAVGIQSRTLSWYNKGYRSELLT
ncbi:hypothetical protein SB48_HM08orf04880 [Heyndrickxia coagulans]|uniref:Uncharacterized protein n=1 Tax=Heyndrickxia coagulans TaxID=1398 RepID=A0AAN0WCV4_HEYCO|nr:hypothetical protein SB48_HM08orf04880 [Heyndrickxia coagulans]KYC62906.1 hypothetical protein B4100_0410 [Heyndrickxia coagulans]